MNNLTIRLTDAMRQRVEKVAAANGMKPTAFVRFAVAQVLNGEANGLQYSAVKADPVSPDTERKAA